MGISKRIVTFTFLLIMLIMRAPAPVFCQSPNTDDALVFAQKMPLGIAIKVARKFAVENAGYLEPLVITEIEIETGELQLCWCIKFISVNKNHWRQPEVIWVFQDGSAKEKPGK